MTDNKVLNKNIKYRAVVNQFGQPRYYTGRIISEDEQSIIINDFKLGNVIIGKSSLVTMRPLEGE